jgi:hypothetical protein
MIMLASLAIPGMPAIHRSFSVAGQPRQVERARRDEQVADLRVGEPGRVRERGLAHLGVERQPGRSDPGEQHVPRHVGQHRRGRVPQAFGEQDDAAGRRRDLDDPFAVAEPRPVTLLEV